jgi:hypothetical protein
MDYTLAEASPQEPALNFSVIHLRSTGYVNGPRLGSDSDRLQAEGMLGFSLAI